MDGYYAYIVDDDGHVINRVDLAFEHQEDAAERAKGLVDGHDSSFGGGIGQLSRPSSVTTTRSK